MFFHCLSCYFLISRLRCLMNLSRFDEIRKWFDHDANATFSEDEAMMIVNWVFAQTFFTSSEMTQCLKRRRSIRLRSLYAIVLHESIINLAVESIRKQKRLVICSWLRWIFIKTIWISISSIDTKVIRKTLEIVLRHLFCNTVNLLLMSVFFVLNMSH